MCFLIKKSQSEKKTNSTDSFCPFTEKPIIFLRFLQTFTQELEQQRFKLKISIL